MLKTDAIAQFGSQQKLADALTAAGFKISQRGVSAWPEIVPLQWAVPLADLCGKQVDLSQYRQQTSQ